MSWLAGFLWVCDTYTNRMSRPAKLTFLNNLCMLETVELYRWSDNRISLYEKCQKFEQRKSSTCRKLNFFDSEGINISITKFGQEIQKHKIHFARIRVDLLHTPQNANNSSYEMCGIFVLYTFGSSFNHCQLPYWSVIRVF